MTSHNITDTIQRLPEDIRVETVIAQLLEMGYDLDNIIIRPKRIAKRGFRKDIVQVNMRDKDSRTQYITFDISREGFYDSLPEALFHQPSEKYPDPKEEVKIQQKVEDDTRKFFQPFELELYRQRIQMEMEERKTLAGFSNPQQQEWFARFWGLTNKGTSRQLTAMLYLLPIATRIVGNKELTAKCFETVLGERVTITYDAPMKYDIRDILSPLGDTRLGVDLVIGNELQEGIPSIVVTIGPLKQGKVLQYLPGTKSESVLDMLYRYFLPVSADVQTSILVEKEDRAFTLSGEAYASRLGFTSGI